MFYYTYVLKSERDQNHYIGWTNDLRKRFKKHNDGHVKATKSRRPFVLVYYEASKNKEKAIAREKYFKTGFGRKFLRDRV